MLRNGTPNQISLKLGMATLDWWGEEKHSAGPNYYYHYSDILAWLLAMPSKGH